MADYDLVIAGRLATPGGILDDGWLAVADGRIAAIGRGKPPTAAATHRAGDSIVCPGFIDGQVHACSYRGLAGLESTTRAAVAGGLTTIVDMPYDDPEPLTSMATLTRKIAAIEATAHGDVALYATVAKGQGTRALTELAEAGVCAVKLSSFESHPQRFPRIPADEILDVLEAMAATGLPVGLHNEDQEIVRARIARLKAAGRTGAEWHSESRPEAAELASTAHFLELGAASGAHVHIVHFSAARGYELVARYRNAGVRATAELCAHYLHFDPHVDTARLGARLKVNPPIRPKMREALWEEFEAGRVAFVSSDHSSWPIDNKLTPSIFDAGAGMTGLETLVCSFYTDLLRRGHDPIPVMCRQLAEYPARFFGLWPRKGGLVVGADADIVLLAPGARRFDAAGTHDDLNWSAYDGETFEARVAGTYVRGALVWDGESIVGAPGHGSFVPRTGPSIFAPPAA